MTALRTGDMHGSHLVLHADSGRSYQNQERGRSDFDIPPIMSRRHLRLMCHEHRWPEHARLSLQDRPAKRQGYQDLPPPSQCVYFDTLLLLAADRSQYAVYIVKDLVPDLTLFYKQYKSIQPYLQNDNPPEKGEFLQSPEDRKKLDGKSFPLHRRPR